jgi:hypothetical protein
VAALGLLEAENAPVEVARNLEIVDEQFYFLADGAHGRPSMA